MLRAWSTHRIKPRERYPVIADAINATVCPCEVQTDIPMDRFEAELEHIALGEVSVVRYASMGSQLAIRRHKHLQASDPDAVLLYLPLTARFRVEQSGQALSVDPGTLALVPLTRPLVGLFEASNTAVGTGVQVRMPLSMLRRGQPRIGEVFSRPLSLDSGCGRVARSLILSVIDEGRFIQQPTGSLGKAIADAICSLADSELRGPSVSTGAARQRSALRTRLLEFVDAHLARDDLDVDLIAARCAVSVRCVHRAFEDSDWTVWGYIRHQRLQQCRAELRDPEMRGRTMSEIAYAWGFKDVAHFSRAYKAQFGVSPSADRFIHHSD